MRTRIIALAGMLVLSLVTSATLAAERPIGDYEPSFPGGVNPVDGILKDQNDCPEGTAFFKNQFPGLTNGPGGSFAQLTYPIDGTDVTFQVFWAADNSFNFQVLGGVAHVVGVTSDTNNLLYDYVNFSGTPVSGDGNLNKISNAADVNHLDFCLTVDAAPQVVITTPTANQIVSGTIAVEATVTDDIGVDPTSVTASINGTAVTNTCLLVNPTTGQYACSLNASSLASGNYAITVSADDTAGNTSTGSVNVVLDNSAPVITINSPSIGDQVSATVTVAAADVSDVLQGSVKISVNDGQTADVAMTCTLQPQTQFVYQCSYDWETADLPAGPYTIEISATDANNILGTASVIVEVVKSFADCFGTLTDDDLGLPGTDPFGNGCNPTGLVNVQTAPDTAACAGPNPPNFCFLAGTLLKPHPDNATLHCGEFGFPDPRMNLVGSKWVPDQPGRALNVFEEIGIDPALESLVQAALPPGQLLADAVVLDENTYCANGCCAIAQHVKGYVTEGLPGEPPIEGNELNVLYPVWPQNPATGLIFIKTHFPEDVLPAGVTANCYGYDPDGPTGPLLPNYDLQDAAGAGYVPIDQQLDDYGFVSVLTQRCVNPARTLTRNNGFDISNVVEAAGIDFDADPVAVLNFKYGLSADQFDLVFAALDCSAPLLLTGKFSDVSSPVNQAKRRFDNFNPRSLGQSIGALEDAADALRTQTTWLVTERNCPGEALGRIEHLIWDLGLLKLELERLEGLGIL